MMQARKTGGYTTSGSPTDEVPLIALDDNLMALDGGAMAYELYCSKLRGVIRYAWEGEEVIRMWRAKPFRDYVAWIADPEQARLMAIPRPLAADAAKSIKFKGTPDAFDKRAAETWERLSKTYVWALSQVLPPGGLVGIVYALEHSYMSRVGVQAQNDLSGSGPWLNKESGNGLLQRLGLTRRSRPCHPGEFEIAAAAIQLDACLALISESMVEDRAYEGFCHDLVFTVAGHYGHMVMEHLANYCAMRERCESAAGVISKILLFASMRLQASWSGDQPDARYSAPYVSAAIDLIWQGKAAKDLYFSRMRSGGDSRILAPLFCLGSFLRHGRRRMAAWLESVCSGPYVFI